MKTFTVTEAARELGISQNMVYALCQRRKIKHERHGLGRRGKIIIPEDALAEYRRSVTVEAGKTVGTLPSSPPPRIRLKHLKLS